MTGGPAFVDGYQALEKGYLFVMPQVLVDGYHNLVLVVDQEQPPVIVEVKIFGAEILSAIGIGDVLDIEEPPGDHGIQRHEQ